jgi:hypothetical protein
MAAVVVVVVVVVVVLVVVVVVVLIEPSHRLPLNPQQVTTSREKILPTMRTNTCVDPVVGGIDRKPRSSCLFALDEHRDEGPGRQQLHVNLAALPCYSPLLAHTHSHPSYCKSCEKQVIEISSRSCDLSFGPPWITTLSM